MVFGEKYIPFVTNAKKEQKPNNFVLLPAYIKNPVINKTKNNLKELKDVLYGPLTEKELKLAVQSQDFISLDSPNRLREKIKKIRQSKNFNTGLDENEILKIIQKIDKKYDKKRKEKQNSKEKKKKRKLIKNINNKSLIETKIKNNDNYIFKISKEQGEYNLTTNYGIIDGITSKEYNSIGIKEKDGKIIIQNPDILKNLINFYKFFKDLNLLGIWKYRKDIVKAIGDIDINLEDDSLKKTELLRFGNILIDFINNLEKDKDNGLKKSNSINTLKEELRGFSGANSPLSENKTFNIYGEGNFVANLRNLGIIGGAYFHIMQFRDILNGKKLQKNK